MKTKWGTRGLSIVIFVLCSLVGLAVVAHAAKGGQPNGKPFQAIQSQILSIEMSIEDLQLQIDQVASTTSDLMERVDIIEGLIVTLQDENALIIQRLETIEAEALLLGQEVDANSTEIQSLAAQYSQNSEKIAFLEGQVADLEDELDGKQDILQAQCAEGFAFREIHPDGTVICQSMEVIIENGDITVTNVRISAELEVAKASRTCKTFFITCLEWNPWEYNTIRPDAECPDDYVLTGSSHAVYEAGSSSNTEYQGPDTLNVLVNEWPHTGPELVTANAKNFSTTTDYRVASIANCLKVE